MLIYKIIKLCQAVRKERDIKWQHISVKKEQEQIVIKRKNSLAL